MNTRQVVSSTPIAGLVYITLLMSSFLAAGSANAAPGWSATGLTVSPTEAPKVVAALDALFESRIGARMPGRVTLRLNVADGQNLETHTVVTLFKSMADAEEYRTRLYADPAWNTFLDEISKVNRNQGSTMMGLIVWNSGDLSDKDKVWVNHYLSVDEPGVVLSAMNTYSQTDAGKAQQGQVHLSAVIGGGIGGPSHIVSVGFASDAEWEKALLSQSQNSAYQTLITTLGAVSDYHGATVHRELKSWGEPIRSVTTTGN